jgi:iron complex outermembrane receptor protein
MSRSRRTSRSSRAIATSRQCRKRGSWGATWQVRYISRIEEDCSFAVDPQNQCSQPFGTRNVDGLASNGLERTAINEFKAMVYNDLQVRWAAPWKASVRVGVRNIFDNDPPVSIATFANSFDPSYDVPGRFWYVRYTHVF